MIAEAGMGRRLDVVRVTVVALLLAAIALPAWAQGAAEADAIKEQVVALYGQGKHAEAAELAKRALALREAALPAGHPDIATSLNDLAFLYHVLGRLAEAEPLYQRALALREAALPAGHPDIAQSLHNLAGLYQAQGRLTEAEPLHLWALAIREAALPAGDPDIAQSLNILAFLYNVLGRLAEAEPLFKRALALYEAALPAGHPDIALSLNNLAVLYQTQGRLAEAEPLFKRALALTEEALPAGHPDIAQSVNNLAAIYQAQGRLAEAEPLFKRALALYEAALPAGHPDIALSLNNLAALHQAQSRLGEAEPLFKRALALREAALPAGHPDIAGSLNNLAALYFVQRDWGRAADFWRRSTGILMRRAERGTADVGQALTGRRKGEAEQLAWQFWGLVKAVHRLVLDGRGSDINLSREMFQTAQWALSSEAAGSLAQMAARSTRGDAALAALVRERQDLVEEWQRRDGVRSAAVAQEPGKRDRAAEAANVARLAAMDTRIAAIDKTLVAEFPDYAALARPTPLSIEEVQAQLGTNEALVLFLDTPDWTPTPEETFIWVVTKTTMRWVRSDVGTAALKREVAALRCGLDAALWDDEAASARCRDQTRAAPERDVYGNIQTETLPFPRSRSHALYKALFGEVEDLIRDKHLLVVPSGALTQLPFQVLVTAPHGDDGDYRAAKWLARQNALTVLPAVSSLKALRRVAKPSGAKRPMLGVGNPLLDGDPLDSTHAKWAKLAREKQTCPQTIWRRVAGLVEKRSSVQKVATRGGHADLDHLRSQVPLHDTADELCAVAKALQFAPDDILLGAKATETSIKALSSEGKLADYRIVHFATHGTLAGEIESTSEPGLILTPPQQQTDVDDGYLSASEVAALKLDADWVILSACNTAAGGSEKAEALSGLARAFFYAGARALLVSHWSVNSEATVSLITQAVGEISRDKTIGRAEGLRRAMLAMIDKGKPHEAHPAYWAPFVVVGEGAPGK
jgi:CHAT domain-containing protein/tetratricopeptide (TPR) repeat protein